MTLPKVSDIAGIINKIAPFRFAEGWDNVGLQVGDPGRPVERLAIALDAGQAAVDNAIQAQCQLLLTHHPLIFTPLKKITFPDPVSRIITTALKHDLAILSLHTNFDIAAGGINDLLAQRLGIQSCIPLKDTGSEELLKLTVFVPNGHETAVLESLMPFSAVIGNYSDCSFRSEGIGTFRPHAGARPFIGEEGRRESVRETRVEVLVRRLDLAAAINAMLKAHPYEEPAFDLYPLLNEGKTRGLGRIGKLPEEMSLGAFARLIKERLELKGLRIVGDSNRIVRKIALCGGSGISLLREAMYKGADLFLTGDIKYHEAREAESLGIALVDAGHFGTERLMVEGLADMLREETAKKKLEVGILPFMGELEPFEYL